MAENTSKQFSNEKIYIRLDESNYLQWKQQVEFMVTGHGLESYIDGTPPPPEFVVSSDGTRVRNAAFAEYKQVDSALALWLLSSISASILPSLVNCRTSRSIWTTLQPASSTTRIMSLLISLFSQRKGNLAMREYLGRIQIRCDRLASSDHGVTETMQIAVILAGLGPEYESSVSDIISSLVPFDLASTTSVLLDAEARQQDTLLHFGALNLNSTALNVSVNNGSSSTVSSTNLQGNSSREQRLQPQLNNQVMSQNQGQAMAFGRGRGRGYNQNRPQCQLCGRFGHLVTRCWYKFDHNYGGVGAQASNNGLFGPPPIGANSDEFLGYILSSNSFGASADVYPFQVTA